MGRHGVRSKEVARRKLVAPKRYIRIIQSYTVAVYFLYDGIFIKGVTCKHHDITKSVYFRKGKKECIRRFKSRANATA